MTNVRNTAFSAGELSPALYARTDLEKYEVGLRQCRNFIVMRQGGATKRPGTEFIAAVADESKKGRLIPFIFNQSDTLVLEFGEHTIRFIQDGGQVIDPITFDPLEVATSYLEADLPDLQYVQSADVMTLVHPSYPPQELKRFTDTNWTLTPIVFNPSIAAPTGVTVTGGAPPAGPPTNVSVYQVTAVTATGEESLASVEGLVPHFASNTFPISISWAAVTGAASYKVYKLVPDLIGTGTGSGVFAFLGETSRNTNYGDTGAIIPDITLQPPVPSTLFQALNDYPAVVAYYQQRLIFANSNNHPDTVWTSRTGFYHNFTTSVFVQDDDAITFRLVSDEVDAVRHILNVGRMVVLTDGAEWIVEGDGNGVLTPTSVNSRIGATDGVAKLKPIKAANQLLFLQSLGSEVRELQANVQFGYYSLQSADVTIYSTHLVDGFTITEWAFQQIPTHVLWAVRSDGVLLGLTYIPDQQLMAWHRHDTRGFVESVCAVPEGKEHFVYWIARRLIQGNNPPTTIAYHRYIERQTSTIQAPIAANQPGPGTVITPPPPPPIPLPNPTPIAAPTNPSTTDITTTGATANWIAGNTSAGSTVQIRVQGQPDSAWVSHTIAAGQQSFVFTGLSSGVAYEWRVQHFIGSEGSPELGPNSLTQFTTVPVTPTLSDPVSAPTITVQAQSTGLTNIIVQWIASPQGGNANVQIGGPTAIAPTDGEFTQIGAGDFIPAVTGALWSITVAGDYWVRVKYEAPGFISSQFVESSSILVTVL